jgi:predicted adenylyl cyclase CyaB
MPKDDPLWNIFRIRKQGDKTILTLKHKASHRSRDNHELELEIADAVEMAKILERVGYTRDVNIYKTRQTATWDGYELCLDTLRDYGDFIEIECLTDETADVEKVEAELWSMLQKLGIDEQDRFDKGYDQLVRSGRGVKL